MNYEECVQRWLLLSNKFLENVYECVNSSFFSSCYTFHSCLPTELSGLLLSDHARILIKLGKTL